MISRKCKTAWLGLVTATVMAGVMPFGVTSAGAQAPLVAATAASPAKVPAAPGSGCAGSDTKLLPSTGDITNPSGTDGGFYYYTIVGTTHGGAMCVGRVREWVYYTSNATKTWRVTIEGVHVAALTVTGLAGHWYYTDFQVNSYFRVVPVCIGASNTYGYSCAAP